MARTRRSLVFTGPETIQIRTGDVPDPDPDTVLVRASLSAISPGTERLIYRGLAPAELPADPTFDSLSGSLSYPLQYGYAAVGHVVETGANVSEAWLGERVLAFHPHESHFLADPGTLVPIPDTISEARAALLPSIETAVSLVHDGAPRLGETVVVFGQGLVGLLVTSILSAFPLSNLVAVEPIERRRHRSRSFGADESVHPDALDTAVSMPTDGDDEPTGADLTYELSGNPEALDRAIA
ncbi:MAG: zinc-dependent alcohol dehydrogenase, partial [Halobacteriota archaeon]